MYLPTLLLFAVMLFYPFLAGIQLSFTDWNGYSNHYRWVGLAQYERIFTDPNTARTLINTLIYGIGSTLLQNVLGLAYALVLNSQLRGKSVLRMIVYFPVLISPLIMGYIFYFIFQYHGGLNEALQHWGYEPINWLGSRSRAVWLITLVNTFQYMGVAMMIYLAGLQAIPREIYEAARMDGASPWRIFYAITLPMLMPAITISVVINIIGGLKLFDTIIALTNGGPGFASHSLSTLMYDLYFASQDAGFAAALGNVMFVLIAVISICVLRWLRRREIEA